MALSDTIKKHESCVVYFTATWCGPCQKIKPMWKELEKEWKETHAFIIVDIDEEEDVAREFGVTCMPTFLKLAKGVQVGKMEGADEGGLRRLVCD